MVDLNIEAAVLYARNMVGMGGFTAQCERFVRTMYGLPRKYGSAKEAYYASASHGPIHRDYNAPPGVPVYWDLTGPNAKYGHVALSIGGGWAISTSNEKGQPGICAINIRKFTDASAPYLGWAEFYHGYRVYDPPGQAMVASSTIEASQAAVANSNGPLFGVDVHARWQKGLVASSLSNVSFVITKCTGGKSFVVDHWYSMLSGATLTGVYHYAREKGNAGDPYEEAQNFVSQARNAPSDALLILDWEESTDTNLGDADWVLSWMSAVEQALGRRPVFYTYDSVLKRHPSLDRVRQAGYALWYARYPTTDKVGWRNHPAPTVPYWGSPVMWQYSSSGGVPGYSAELDLNIFYGNADDWRRLAQATGVDTTRKANDMFIIRQIEDGKFFLVSGTSFIELDQDTRDAYVYCGVPEKALYSGTRHLIQSAQNRLADAEQQTQDAWKDARYLAKLQEKKEA